MTVTQLNGVLWDTCKKKLLQSSVVLWQLGEQKKGPKKNHSHNENDS